MTINADLIDTAVADLASYFGEILVSKGIDKAARAADLFEEFSEYLKANDDGSTPQSLSSQLNEMSSASGVPLEVLLHTARGARLLERLNELTKKEEPMSRSDEMVAMRKFVQEGGMSAVAKYILESGSTSLNEHEYTELVQENARRKGISFEKAFEDRDTQLAYKIVRDSTQLQAYLKSYPGKMSVQVVSVETGDTNVPDDSFKAAAQLKALVEEQRARAPWMTAEQVYDAVYRDPANRSVTARAHPMTSSTS